MNYRTVAIRTYTIFFEIVTGAVSIAYSGVWNIVVNVVAVVISTLAGPIFFARGQPGNQCET